MSKKLFLNLIDDEKKINQKLYSSGPYWKHKNKRTIYQIKKNKLIILEELTAVLVPVFQIT